MSSPATGRGASPEDSHPHLKSSSSPANGRRPKGRHTSQALALAEACDAYPICGYHQMRVWNGFQTLGLQISFPSEGTSHPQEVD